ncbi:hypothetical protein [Rhizobium sp. 768_B6_N1_8]|uniref:hypothetical protein n=1 Tax=unclassified Rhizobium TaxID=2613769 RepID=UPI003F26EB57
MRSDQRQFFVFDLEIAARKEGAQPPTIDVVIAIWQKFKDQSQVYEINNGSASMLIGDIRAAPNEDHVTLLVRLSDKKAPNSVYSKIVTNSFVEHEKDDDTGSDLGCHVVVSRVPETDQPNVYTCAVERIPGLPSVFVKRMLSKFLNIEFNQVSTSFQYPSPGGGLDKDGNPRVERCCPHIELRGRPSDQFVHDLEEGVLLGVKLVKAEAITPMTGAGYLVKDTSELRLQVVKDSVPAHVWSSLQSMLNAYSQDYWKSEVSYRLPNSRRVVTVDIDNATGSPINDLYIQQFEIMNIFPPLAQSSQAIVARLMEAAVPLFLAHRNL